MKCCKEIQITAMLLISAVNSVLGNFSGWKTFSKIVALIRLEVDKGLNGKSWKNPSDTKVSGQVKKKGEYKVK